MSEKQINILQFICHDLGQELNCYGRNSIQSPNINALAEQGVRFSNHFCASTPCSPARGCIMTGRYSHTNQLIGLVNHGWDLPEREKTIIDYLNDAGYQTRHFGLQHERKDKFKNHYLHEHGGYARCEECVPKLIEFLESPEAKNKPWYANIGTNEVHYSWDKDKYTPLDPEKIEIPSYLPDNPDVRLELARFYGSIKYMDEWVGKIMETLDNTGLNENTLFIFTTDHGSALPRAKSMLYDPGMKTALIMRFPESMGISPNVYKQLINNIDLTPALLDMIGKPIPDRIQGRSFLPLLTGNPYTEQDEIFSEKNFHDNYDPIRCIRTKKYKYIRNFDYKNLKKIALPADMRDSIASNTLRPDAHEQRDPVELYNLEKDPGEETNLADDPEYKSIKDELAGKLEKWMKSTNDFLPGPMPDAPPEQVFDESPK